MEMLDLDGAPYAKVRTWMIDELGLKGSRLMAFALLWERDHAPAEDTGRIDGGYLASVCGSEPDEAFKLLSDLVVKDRLVVFDLSSRGGALDGFHVDRRSVEKKLAPRDGAGQEQ